MLIQALPATLPPEMVRDTVAAVLASGAYDRSLRQTLWSRISSWIGTLFERLNELAAGSPVVYWSSRALLALLLLAVAGRLAYLLWARWESANAAGRARWTRGPLTAAAADALARADAEAAAGRYTEAAHLLYQALLETLARRERLRLHPSKTVGDYVRELRARSSGALAPFREFGRTYETVVYGLQYCDRDRYARLRLLAAPLVGTHG